MHKKNSIIVGVIFLFLISFYLWPGGNGEPGKGEYMGQKKPGLTPEVFAPGIVSTNTGEFAIAFLPDGKEFYFTRHVVKDNGRGLNTIMVAKMIDGRWTGPETAPFSGKYFDFEPYISPEGKRLYFGTTRPLAGDGPPGKLHQWVLEKTETGWSPPKPLNSPFKERFVMYPTQSKNKNIYFTGMRKGTTDCELYLCRWKNGKYGEPESLNRETVNMFPHAAHSFIAPDESYLIFDAKETPESTSDIYISFKKKDGSWTKAKKMDGKINTGGEEGCAGVSPDGKYLFFSRDGDIYWVDAKIIEDYRECKK